MDAELRSRLATLLGEAYPDRAGALLAEVESWYAVDNLGWDCARCLSRGETDWLAGLDIGPRSFQGGGRTSVPKVSLQPATAMQPAMDVDEELEDETWDRPRVRSVPMIALCRACLDTLDAGFDAAVGEQLDPSMVLSELSRALRMTGASDAERLLAELLPSRFDLDTRDLTIVSVVDGSAAQVRYEVSPPEPIFGSRLRLFPPAGTQSVTIAYRTSPNASALQWLAPAQTTGKKHPYLFSQCQTDHRFIGSAHTPLSYC